MALVPIGREVTWRFVVSTKFAQNLHFAYVCVQNTGGNHWLSVNALKQCLFCLFGHLHNFLFLQIYQDQITKNKNHKNNEIYKK